MKNLILLIGLSVLSLICVYTIFSSTFIWSASWNEADATRLFSASAPRLLTAQVNVNESNADTKGPLTAANVTQLESGNNGDPRFPEKSLAILPPTMKDKKVLVVFSGPTEFIPPNTTPNTITRPQKKMELYRLNFDFFIEHGIQCQAHDTILVVTDVVAARYQSQIDRMHDQCEQDHGHYVRLVVRNNTCLDLESVRVALEYADKIGRPAVVTDSNMKKMNQSAYYDYFVYLNCGVTGPSPQWASLPWTNVFLQGLRDGVKMTGLSMNCVFYHAHIQSMMYAMDKEGLQVVVDGGAIYDCTKRLDHSVNDHNSLHGKIVQNYELKMSNLLLHAGYGISSILRPITIFQQNRTLCLNRYGNDTLNDMWIGNPLNEYFGKVPSLDEVIFFKTSRILTPETAELINFTMVVDWNWFP